MSFNLASLLGGGLAETFKSIVGTFKLSPEKKAEIEAAISENEYLIRMKEYELQVRGMDMEAATIDAQKSIIVAEMQQSDAYTKRARPTIVYAGLLAIFLAHIIMPYISHFTRNTVPDISLPTDFWYVWGAVCSVWFVGRTLERKGIGGGVVRKINGDK